jgi:hypothetical protein
VEQAGKPVADIGAIWEFVVKEAIEIATIQTFVHSQRTSEIKRISKLYYVNLCKN